jgi:hybrid cluster-associated redox disulfide protein
MERRSAVMTATKKVTKDTVIGDIVKSSPDAKKVIEKYFGNGCFTCPGIRVESISFGAMMHNVDPQKIIDELNALEE